MAKTLPFGRQTAYKLMAVAADKRLAGVAHVRTLPASWGTLYELTKLDDKRLSNTTHVSLLPASRETLYELSRLDDKQWHYQAEARQRQREGAKKGGEAKRGQPKKGCVQLDTKLSDAKKSRTKAAKALGVSTGTVARAKRVAEHPDLNQKMTAGELSVSAAYEQAPASCTPICGPRIPRVS